ncbi:MAG: MBOAT family protein [Ruminococcaceae bacterium]|nr:MBOAT family protein [Oscillospiraceae bacterium]
MLFSSIPFLYYFLPSVLILYFIVPKKLKNTVLMLSSLVFYGWGEPKYVVLMIASIVIGYFSGILIEAFSQKKLSKIFLGVSVAINLGFLAYFKYADFFIENFNAVTGLSISLLRIALPIGISFYTFQILSYTIDVYRKDVPAQKNIINLAAYITMFPQLIAGPIVRYSDIAKQLEGRTHSFENFSKGMRRFVLGLGKKILIANSLGELCDVFKASDDKSVLFYWLYAVAFGLHVYFDFSGYSDMAIGLGRIFGFHFSENFNYPYISKSATEFWRRWHMSLGTWFRDYVYIPLGGNRVSKLRWFFNIFVVWFLTGFWHGAAWNFIIWGLFFAVLLIAEKVFLLKYLNKSKVLSRIYTLVAVGISFVIFNATDMKEAASYIGGMFGAGDAPLASTEFFYYLKSFAVTLVIGIIGATPIVKKVVEKVFENTKASKFIWISEPVGLIVLLAVMTAYLVDGSFNPFLYFRF